MALLKLGQNTVTPVIVVGSSPTGTISISSNGTYNVSSYAFAEVNVPSDIHNTNVTITPSTSSQTLTPQSPYTGYGTITVNPVTSSIDANIVAGNIKDGVTILGVTGNYSGGITPTGTINITTNGTYDVTNYASAVVNVPASGDGIPREISNGIYDVPSSQDFTFSLPNTVDIIGDFALAYAFRGCSKVKSVNLSSVKRIQGYGLYNAFYECGITSINFSSLTNTGGADNKSWVFNYAFYNNPLTSISFPVLVNAGGRYSTHYFDNAFASCNLTSINFPALEVVGTNGFSYAFRANKLVSVVFPSVNTIYQKGFEYAFQVNTTLTSLSFPALTSTSFKGGLNDEFNRMLAGVTGCTVHFPSNLQSVIGNWSDVLAGFGGTNTTVLFDLPRTEGITATFKIFPYSTFADELDTLTIDGNTYMASDFTYGEEGGVGFYYRDILVPVSTATAWTITMKQSGGAVANQSSGTINSATDTTVTINFNPDI